FLQLLGLSAAANFVVLPGCHGDDAEAPPPPPSPDFITTLIRRDDLVFLRFDFFNCVLNQAGTAIVAKGSGDRFMAVTRGPQHIFEEAVPEEPPNFVPLPPIDARIAGPSRLAFRIPDEVMQIPLKPEELLRACASYELSVSANALPPVAPQIDV